MARFLRRILPNYPRKWNIVFLAFIWMIGLVCGVVLFSYAGDSVFSLMRTAALSRVSIVNLLTVSLLPFLFSAVVVYIHSYPLLVGLCFIKACLFGFVSMGILIAFDSAGWLIRLFLMFSDCLCLVPLWWYWIYQCSGQRRFFSHGLAASVLLAVSIVGLDYCYISPFLVKLMEF